MARVSYWAAGVAGLLVVSQATAADIKSGIEVGESIRAFNPQHVTGPDAGKSSCLV